MADPTPAAAPAPAAKPAAAPAPAAKANPVVGQRPRPVISSPEGDTPVTEAQPALPPSTLAEMEAGRAALGAKK